MRILTFRRMIGLAAIGGAVYVHKQRGGTWTMASMRDTLRHLLSVAVDKLGQLDNQVSGQSSGHGERGEIRSGTGSQVGSQMGSSAQRPRISEENRPRTYGEIPKRDDTGRH